MDGYNRLACLASTYPELLILKKFRNANVLNLLYLQAEVVNLEYDLGRITNRDRKPPEPGSPDRRHFESHVDELKSSDDGNSEQWQIVLALRARLKEYNEALLTNRALFELPSTPKVNLTALQEWLKHSKGGHNFLQPYEYTVWDEGTDLTDLTSLANDRERPDFISQWIIDKFVSWYHYRIGKKHKKLELPLLNPVLLELPITTPMTHYPLEQITFVIDAASTVLSSFLPVLSMFILYYVHRPLARLGVILAITLLFSIVVAVITRARRIENFAATAAFSAVLVVFIGAGPSATSHTG